MDPPNPSVIPTAANCAPVRIGAVGMRVRDLDRVTARYRDMLGLTVQEHTRQVAVLGVGGVSLLELIHKPDALPDDPREAGLYHTALLMPTRADLARWILHAAKNRVPFTGASDHDVSEAIYRDDPEGNGVEVYSDRQQCKLDRFCSESRYPRGTSMDYYDDISALAQFSRWCLRAHELPIQATEPDGIDFRSTSISASRSNSAYRPGPLSATRTRNMTVSFAGGNAPSTSTFSQ
jgi:catechol 2,3-dioxygenase-like lactoylglutathione lyase family enzyme